MAKSIEGLPTAFIAPVATERRVALLRLILGSVVLLGTLLFLFGTSWDIQWHSFIGRDRTLIPPHIMMLSGVAISGFAALFAVFSETWLAQQDSSTKNFSTCFVETFYSSLGAYIAGFAALDAAIAFPLDSYWHSLYGIDVAIWAPFHVMFLSGMGIVALGSVFMLSSATQLTSSTRAIHIKRLSNVSLVLALATMIGIFSYLLMDARDSNNYLPLGPISLSFFPCLLGLLSAWGLGIAIRTLPWRAAASVVALVNLSFALLMQLFVPPATDFLVNLERLRYLHGRSSLAAVAIQWPLTLIFAAILVDIIRRRAQRKAWSMRKQAIWLTLCLGLTPMLDPISTLSILLANTGREGPLETIFTNYAGTKISTLLLSMLLGLVGAGAGYWISQHTSPSASVDREKRGLDV